MARGVSKRVWWGFAVAAFAVVGFAAAGCSDDDNPTGGGNGNNGGGVAAPAEWVGRWAGTTTTTDCVGRLLSGAEPDTFSICEDDEVEDLYPETFQVNCSVTWNSTILDFNCTASATFQTCTINATIDGMGTRSGDQVNISQETNFDYSGKCFGEEDFCEMTTASYTRISTSPDLSECGFGEGEGRSAVEGWVRESLGSLFHP